MVIEYLWCHSLRTKVKLGFFFAVQGVLFVQSKGVPPGKSCLNFRDRSNFRVTAFVRPHFRPDHTSVKAAVQACHFLAGKRSHQ